VISEVAFYPDEINRETAITLITGRRYAVQIAIPLDSRGCEAEVSDASVTDRKHLGKWHDASIPVTSTAGIDGKPRPPAFFLPFRRIWSVNWFVPIAAIGRKIPERHYLIEPTTEFTTTREGPLSLYVNDAAFPFGTTPDGGFCRTWDCYYQNNSGGPARVRVTELDANMRATALPSLAAYTCREQIEKLTTAR
jgi:hypothetical protein